MTSPEGIPYIVREIVPPPSKPFEILNPVDSLRYLKQTKSISRGAKILAGSLLRDGNVVEFPGGEGLDYEDIFKVYFDPKATSVSYLEMIKKHNLRDMVDAVIVPEYSAIAPGTLMASLLGKSVIRLRKNGNCGNNKIYGQIDSYTGGGKDTLFLSERTLKKLEREKETRLLLFDDISDTGGMSELVASILELAQKNGFNVKLVASGATLAKGYTGAAEKIQKKLGILTFSGLTISDLGMEPNPWISIEGIDDVSFSFSNN